MESRKLTFNIPHLSVLMISNAEIQEEKTIKILKRLGENYYSNNNLKLFILIQKES